MSGPAVDWPRVFSAIQTAQMGEDGRARRARALIDRAFSTPLDLDRLAAEARLSRAHFIRAFKCAYATTPHQYVVHRRLGAALHLLETTSLSVTDICLEVGFSSLGSFSTLFRRRYGHSPSRYRRATVTSLGLFKGGGPPRCFMIRYGAAQPSGLALDEPPPDRSAKRTGRPKAGAMRLFEK